MIVTKGFGVCQSIMIKGFGLRIVAKLDKAIHIFSVKLRRKVFYRADF